MNARIMFLVAVSASAGLCGCSRDDVLRSHHWQYYRNIAELQAARDELQETERLLRRSLKEAEALHDDIRCGISLRDLGEVLMRRGDSSGAVLCFERSVRFLRQGMAGVTAPERRRIMLSEIAGSLELWADSLSGENRLEKASACYGESLALLEDLLESSSRRGEPNLLTGYQWARCAGKMLRLDLPGKEKQKCRKAVAQFARTTAGAANIPLLARADLLSETTGSHRLVEADSGAGDFLENYLTARELLYRRRDPAAAVKLLSSLLESLPPNQRRSIRARQIHLELGMAYATLGRLDEAESALATAVELAAVNRQTYTQENLNALSALTNILWRRANVTAAESCLRESLRVLSEVHPHDQAMQSAYRLNLGAILVQARKFEEGKRILAQELPRVEELKAVSEAELPPFTTALAYAYFMESDQKKALDTAYRAQQQWKRLGKTDSTVEMILKQVDKPAKSK